MTAELERLIDKAEDEWIGYWKEGPTRTRWSKLPPQVGDPAPDFEILDANGRMQNLSSFWSERPALILFWRQYGCGCGVDRAKRLQQEYDDYIAAGANIVIIGQGEPTRATHYAEKYNLPPVPILCDPDYHVYEAYGLLEAKESQIFFDAPEQFLDRDFDAGLELAAARRADGRPVVDNPWLLPGEFVVDSKGVLRLTYRYNYCEDFPDHRVHLAALRQAKEDAE